MNPFESFIIIISGLLLIGLITHFLNELRIIEGLNDKVDLTNIISIRNHALLINASFNLVYKPINNGSLMINETSIKLNNEIMKNNGAESINCDYDLIIINEGGFTCLKA